MSSIPSVISGDAAVKGLPMNQIPGSGNRVIWVDANSGTTRKGTKDNPYATIAIAIGKAVVGDTILIAAGHTENIVDATTFAVDVAGLTIRGLGQGNRVPTFTMITSTASAVMITVANTVLENLKFVAGLADLVQAIDLDANADGTIIRNCVFRDTGALDFKIHMDIDTTIANVIIEGCDFITGAGAMTSSIFFGGSSDTCIIRNNKWHVDCSASVIDHLTGNSLNLRIHNNRIVNIDGNAGLVLGVKSDATATGAFYDNYVQCPLNSAVPFAVTSLFFVCQNFASHVINLSGVLDPAAGAVP